jgi:hypothetical protein
MSQGSTQLPCFLGESGHGLDHVGEAGHMGAHITGRGGADDVLALGNLPFPKRLGLDLFQIIADGLGETRGIYGDDLRLVHGKDVVDGLEQVGLTAEYRSAFGKRAGGGGDGLLVVPCQRASVVGTATLGTVAVRQAPVDAQGCVHGPDGLAGLGRIDRQGAALGYFFWCMSQ